MKKLLVSVFAHLLVVGFASATVSVNWITYGRILDPANGNLPVADGAIALLIWSPDKLISPWDPWNPLAPTGNDILIRQSATSNGGYITDGVVNIDGASPTTPLPGPYNVEDGELDGLPFGDYAWGPPTVGDDAMVFTRIFNSATPGPDSYWGEAALMTLVDQTPPFGAGPGPQTLDYTGGVDTPLTTFLPEPSTWVLVALSPVMIAVYRFRRSRIRSRCS